MPVDVTIKLYIQFNLCQPFPKWHIVDSSKLKEFADDNLKFDENGGQFSKQVKSTVEKG